MNPVQKRRKPANSKKGTTAICKAPNKNNPSGRCDKPYIVNKDRIKDHKYCSNACKSRANYYNKKKQLKKTNSEIKKFGVSSEVELIEVKKKLEQLELINNLFEQEISHTFFSTKGSYQYVNALNNVRVIIEDLLSLCANSLDIKGTKYNQVLDATKRKVLKTKIVKEYLKEKDKQEKKGYDRDWQLVISSIPNYMPIHLMNLLTD